MTTTSPSHEPTPDELAHTGSDGGHHPGDLAGEAHGPDDHGEAHGHDDHAHGPEPLGPVNVHAWVGLAIGVAAGLLIVLCLVITTGLSAGPSV